MAEENKATMETAEKSKKKKPKKWIILIVILVIVLAVAGAAYLLLIRQSGGAEDAASMETMDTMAVASTTNHYSGVVIAEDTWNITKDADRTIDQVNVKVGDEVHVGDVLFTYSTSDTAVKIESAQVEVEGLQNTLTDYNNQIAVIERQKSKTQDEDELLQYESQISQINVNIRQAQLSIKTKQVEINDLQAKLDASQVISTMDGIVQTINGTTYYMTILGTGKFKVKGSVDELTVYGLYEGEPVYVHSRVGDDVWTGTITKVDTGKTDDTSTSITTTSEGGESATKYSFTVDLDDASGLMLGQHVYIETAEGQQ